MKMEFSVGMGRNERIDQVGQLCQVAEESGFSHITFVDQQNLSRDLYVMLTIAALNTRRIQIGQGVTQPFTYHPSVIANATATIDELSGGRAFLGIGNGGNALRSMGMKPRPIQELREAVEFIKGYMAGQEAEYKGARMHSEWIRQPVPVYIAASHGVRSCDLAGEVGDGIIILDAHPEMVKWRMELIEKAALRAGRDPSKIDVWVRAFICIADSKEAALREAAPYAASAARNRYAYLLNNSPPLQEVRRRIERAEPGILDEFKQVYDVWDEYQHEQIGSSHAKLVTPRVMDFFHLVGTVDDISEKVYRLGELGVKNISTSIFTVVDKEGTMRAIGDQIAPHFRN